MTQPTEPGDQPARAHHDMGGVRKFLCEPIDTGAHALNDFDREVDAIRILWPFQTLARATSSTMRSSGPTAQAWRTACTRAGSMPTAAKGLRSTPGRISTTWSPAAG